MNRLQDAARTGQLGTRRFSASFLGNGWGVVDEHGQDLLKQPISTLEEAQHVADVFNGVRPDVDQAQGLREAMRGRSSDSALLDQVENTL